MAGLKVPIIKRFHCNSINYMYQATLLPGAHPWVLALKDVLFLQW